MREHANAIYLLLVRSGVHAFIEFNGMHQKYVDLCERAARAGIDFTQANKHNGVALPVHDHDVIYLAEKFACIFGPTFKANPELWDIFKQVVEAER